jgi:hypothetical protein
MLTTKNRFMENNRRCRSIKKCRGRFYICPKAENINKDGNGFRPYPIFLRYIF